MIAAAHAARYERGRKVRTPQGSVRITSGTDGSSHPDGQCNREHTRLDRKIEVRVKRCGKSAPRIQ